VVVPSEPAVVSDAEPPVLAELVVDVDEPEVLELPLDSVLVTDGPPLAESEELPKVLGAGIPEPVGSGVHATSTRNEEAEIQRSMGAGYSAITQRWAPHREAADDPAISWCKRSGAVDPMVHLRRPTDFGGSVEQPISTGCPARPRRSR